MGQQENGKKGLSRKVMDANASLFMLAGTETTATVLSGLSFLLLTYASTMTNLATEICSTFATSTEISMAELARLPYLNAGIKQAL